LPRDGWLLNRACQQPGLDFFEQSVGGVATFYEIAASASSLNEFCEKMEASGLWLRLDKAVWPKMMHAANVTNVEVEHLRRIGRIVRKGRVRRIEMDKIILEGGEVLSEPHTLYVDCTASALAHNVNDRSPVFSHRLIRLQMVRAFQPTFSAALIGYLEALIEEDMEKEVMAKVTPMTDTAADYVRAMVTGISNQGKWNANETLRAWLRECRLDAFGKTIAEVDPKDAEKRAILRRVGASAGLAIANLERLLDADRSS
jgi:hypothetical protein